MAIEDAKYSEEYDELRGTIVLDDGTKIEVDDEFVCLSIVPPEEPK